MGVFKDRLQILEIHLVDTGKVSRKPVSLLMYRMAATISPIATDQGPLCAPPGKYSDTFPSTHVSQATSPIFKIITTESIAQPELSMSRRRLALNIPSLQRHLSFTSHRNPTTLISPDSSPFELLSVGCLTPMTPAEQIMHTPCHPPDLIRQVPNVTPFQRPALRPWNSNFSSYLPSLLDTAILSPRITDDFNSASSLSQPPARRLSIVTPPDASPVRVPRRLSYSHNLTRSPFSGSQSNRTPLDKALESPLCIRSQRWTRTSSTSETPGNTYFSLPLDITSLRV